MNNKIFAMEVMSLFDMYCDNESIENKDCTY